MLQLSVTMMSWVWVHWTWLRFFYLICRNQPNPSRNLFYSHSLNFHVSGCTLSKKNWVINNLKSTQIWTQLRRACDFQNLLRTSVYGGYNRVEVEAKTWGGFSFFLIQILFPSPNFPPFLNYGCDIPRLMVEIATILPLSDPKYLIGYDDCLTMEPPHYQINFASVNIIDFR